MKKILIVINTMGRAGAERALISMLKSFDYNEYSISLLSIIDRGELFAEVPKQVKVLNTNPSAGSVLDREGIKYIKKLAKKRLFNGGYIFRYFLYVFKNIAWQLRNGRFQPDKLLWLMMAETTPPPEEDYDLAIAYIEGAATYYTAEKVKAEKKVSFVHVNYEKAGYNKTLDHKYFKVMDRIFCVSDSVLQAFGCVFPEFKEKTRIFQNIVIPEDIISFSNKPGGFDDGFKGLRLLTVARLHPQKGLDVAIKAFAGLVGMGYDNVRWYVLGEGAERTRLEAMIEKYGLHDKFFLPGSVENPYTYIKQCDIYVQPSRFEGLSITLLEALLLNKPVVTTDFDGIPDLLTNGYDSLVIKLSEENIISALKTLLDDPQKRESLSQATHELKFDLTGNMSELLAILNGNEV